MGSKIRFGQPRTVEVKYFDKPKLGEVRELAMAAMRDASLAMNAASIPHWLTYGALLGFVREGQLLAHDGDIDFVLQGSPDPTVVAAAMAQYGFVPTKTVRVGGHIGNQKFKRDGVSIDFYHVVEAGDYWRDHYVVYRDSVCSGTHLRMTTSPLDCGSFSVPAPADREAYVAHLYGPNWRKPVVRWNIRFSPPNTTMHLARRDLPRMLLGYLRYTLRR